MPDAVIGFMKAYDAPVGSSHIYTLSFVPVKTLIEAAGEKRVRGMDISQVVPNPDSTSLPLAKDFQAFLKSPYGKGISSNSTNFETYLNTRLLVEAVRMAGLNPTSGKVAKPLKGMNGFSLAGYPINFSETERNGSHYLDMAVIGINGRLRY